MSKSTLTRRTLVASTAAIPAAATLGTLPANALAAPIGADAPLLRLGAELDRVEQDWIAQSTIDAEQHATLEAACEAAGLPHIAYGSIPVDEWRAYQEKRSRIYTKVDDREKLDDDDAWNKIQGPLYRLVDEILSLRASTPAGLAVQAKAVAYAAAELWDPPDSEEQYTPHERLFIEAACAFCGIMPWPIQRRERSDITSALARVS